MRAPFADQQRGHAWVGEIERGRDARRLALVGRDERCPLRIIKTHDAVDDRILGVTARAAEQFLFDLALLGALDRRDEPGFVVWIRTAEGVDEGYEHTLSS